MDDSAADEAPPPALFDDSDLEAAGPPVLASTRSRPASRSAGRETPPWLLPALIGGGAGVAILIVVVVVLWSRLSAGSGPWTADATATTALGPEVIVPVLALPSHPEYRIRPPSGFREQPNLAMWFTDRRSDQSTGKFVVHVQGRAAKPTGQFNDDDLRQAAENWATVIKRNKDGWRQQAIDFGEIDGLRFARVRWKAKDPLTKQELRGFIYVHLTDGFQLSITSEDSFPHVDGTLRATEAAALSLRKTADRVVASTTPKPPPAEATPNPAAPIVPPQPPRAVPGVGSPWTPDANLLAQLGDATPVRGNPAYRFWPPTGYGQQEVPNPAGQATAFIGPVGPTGGAPNVIVMNIKVPDGSTINRGTAQPFFDGMTAQLRATAGLIGFQASRPEFGEVNGVKLARVYWTGMLLMGQQKLRGFVYVTLEESNLITIAGQSLDAPGDESIKLLEASALTLTK